MADLGSGMCVCCTVVEFLNVRPTQLLSNSAVNSLRCRNVTILLWQSNVVYRVVEIILTSCKIILVNNGHR